MKRKRERARSAGRKREGKWRRPEFTAFNIGKMKYEHGPKAGKEPPFCGIDKSILLPWLVGGRSDAGYRRAAYAYAFSVYNKHRIKTNTRARSTTVCHPPFSWCTERPNFFAIYSRRLLRSTESIDTFRESGASDREFAIVSFYCVSRPGHAFDHRYESNSDLSPLETELRPRR